MLREDRAAWLLPWRLSPAAGGRRLRRALASFGGVADQEAEGIRRAHSLRCGRMAVSHSVKERTISENSLIILLQGLQGQVTTVDLRDESVARGRIDNVDAFMNIRLANVTYTDRWGHQVELDDLFVTGRNVRYVHIPDDVNITATIEQQLQLIHRVRNFGSKGQGRREFPSKKYK
ncbi:U7 snRNA-associated Sm-like protein LSm10 isoform X1 [Suricata suricatta]|uniref:U7 snRNA-associated Sm-like protein LSm10 n=2 Tax=Suricata suricatta TaxID=37032 RepID=A0A673UR14_SURSU|nr:U7 snRNA-associated Sm-like protein LSm10 isoform X1 [Suricata suricatta]